VAGQPIEQVLDQAARDAGRQRFRLRLFVAGSSPGSQRAIANLRSICDRFLAGRHDLEVIDIYQQTEMAKQADIVGAPTLIKSLPAPLRRRVGDLSDEPRVLSALGLRPSGG
jgi:circadian clock protein KaiB